MTATDSPPIAAIKDLEWLPVADAARVRKCASTTVLRMVKTGQVPERLMPRPSWRYSGPNPVRHVHMPSLTSNNYQRWNEYTQQYDSMRKPRTRFGAFIRTKRQQMGWRQRDVASALNVKHNTVSEWELGLHTPGVGKAWLLCELFDMSQAERVAVFDALAWAANLEDEE